MSGLRTKRRQRPELPLVPLIDVLVMLVLFSFVTMRFATAQTRNIEAPKFSTAGKNDLSKSKVIAIDLKGVVTVHGKTVEGDGLKAALRALKKEDDGLSIVILADGKSHWDKVADALNICREIRVKSVRLQSQ